MEWTAILTRLLAKAYREGKAVLVSNVDGIRVAQVIGTHGWATVLEDREEAPTPRD